MKPSFSQYLSALAAIAVSTQLAGRASAQLPPAARPPAAPIAPPEPNAPPEKVKEAEKTAQAAALTPITPKPREPTRPAFQL